MAINRFTGVHRRETYAEACRANWPRYTCHGCLSPCRWDRDGQCPSCVQDIAEGFFDRVTTIPKQLLPMKGTP